MKNLMLRKKWKVFKVKEFKEYLALWSYLILLRSTKRTSIWKLESLLTSQDSSESEIQHNQETLPGSSQPLPHH